jgi:hypothetical protein
MAQTEAPRSREHRVRQVQRQQRAMSRPARVAIPVLQRPSCGLPASRPRGSANIHRLPDSDGHERNLGDEYDQNLAPRVPSNLSRIGKDEIARAIWLGLVRPKCLRRMSGPRARAARLRGSGDTSPDACPQSCSSLPIGNSQEPERGRRAARCWSSSERRYVP